MTYNIGLLGLGTVGTGTAEILLNPDGRSPLLRDIRIHRVGVRALNKPRTVDFEPGVLTTNLDAIVADPEIDIIVELIGGVERARELILSAIAHGKHIVTANKAVIARHGDEIFSAAQTAGVYVLLEAAVGGGIPIIQPLKQSLGGNRIERVTGIINGTTNYILTQMQNEGAAFDDVLAEAQALGYAEADPTADVDGFDAADKISILASLAFGGRVRYEDIDRQGIRNISPADITYAQQLGFTIKLLAIAQWSTAQNSLHLRVGPTLVTNHHPLASVNGVFNAILVDADPLGQVMFYGPGAGKGATASAVAADLLNITALLQSEKLGDGLHPLLTCTHTDYCPITPTEAVETRFYARFLCGDRPGVIGHLGTCFGDHNVSLESIVQIGYHQDQAEVVVVTHDVREGDFHAALDAIHGFEEIDDIHIASVFRVL
ncbi:homoserine dehydrogenase [Spirulina major CS-329]|uniref:homoserine dehydrogenase n=1 Tax=Spirulina TaxID=1154 RepID=UPI002330905E|nr:MULTISPECIES: homoserine dehydrogenase [Spirulina]MDB9495416.1 homoserine dehydrogenase [Spirulina subsalsa CS-330]MDB9504064.1 homoserine dehydrogenase [Spirulina major CS-329]